jgi:RNA polymerase sigma factor (TIGR02999 family)
LELSWSNLPDVTLLIRQSQAGDKHAEGQLFHLAYPYLKDIAARLLRREPETRALSPLDLVHDVYLGRLQGWKGIISDRGHYLAFVTTAMRNELIDRARAAHSQKRTVPSSGPTFPRRNASALPYEEIVALEREIDRLEKLDWRAAQVVRLRYYGGCSWDETAAAVGATIKMVRTDWEFAANWLEQRLGGSHS